MNKKNLHSRPWFEVTRRDGRVRLGAIVFLSALGLALFAIVMRTSLLAAPVATTWGNVLIAGGYISPYYLSSTELYDSATNSFFAAADTAVMNVGRQYATATLLPSGKVLIAGGGGASGNLSSTELYDAATDSFAVPADTAVMNTARGEATATLLASGKVLIAGGAGDDTYFTPLASTELYNPATNSFAAAAHTANMNTARTFATATLLPSGQVLIAGGWGASGALSSTELYNPATNSFFAPADTAAMNTARSNATATLLASGKVLIAGGYYCVSATQCYFLSSTELYDPATNSFAAAADSATMNTARADATATLLASGRGAHRGRL